MDITDKIDEAVEKKKFDQKKFWNHYNKIFTEMRNMVDNLQGVNIEDARKINKIADDFLKTAKEVWSKNK